MALVIRLVNTWLMRGRSTETGGNPPPPAPLPPTPSPPAPPARPAGQGVLLVARRHDAGQKELFGAVDAVVHRVLEAVRQKIVAAGQRFAGDRLQARRQFLVEVQAGNQLVGGGIFQFDAPLLV